MCVPIIPKSKIVAVDYFIALFIVGALLMKMMMMMTMIMMVMMMMMTMMVY